MKESKRVLTLDSAEYRQMLHGLLRLSNILLEQGRCPDAVNELLIKLYRVRRCQHG